MPSASYIDTKEKRREGNRAAKRRYYARNRGTVIAKVRAYHESHPEQRKLSSRKSKLKNAEQRKNSAYGHNLKNRYGISVDDYNAMFLAQNGCCAICLTHQSQLKRKLYVDHNHSTGAVRGLLCQHCNNTLGYARDSADILKRAAAYLGVANGVH